MPFRWLSLFVQPQHSQRVRPLHWDWPLLSLQTLYSREACFHEAHNTSARVIQERVWVVVSLLFLTTVVIFCLLMTSILTYYYILSSKRQELFQLKFVLKTRKATPNRLHPVSYLKWNSFWEEDCMSYMITLQPVAKAPRNTGSVKAGGIFLRISNNLHQHSVHSDLGEKDTTCPSADLL